MVEKEGGVGSIKNREAGMSDNALSLERIVEVQPKPLRKLSPTVQVLSSGGGMQSNAMIVLSLQGVLPLPDLVITANTGREMPSTWDYFERWARPALERAGVRVAVAGREYGFRNKDLWSLSGTQLMPTYTNQSGEPGKLTNYCSTRWKIEPVNGWVRKNLDLTRTKFRKWIGFSFDEMPRALRMMRGKEYQRGLLWLPLAEKLFLRREDCKRIVLDFGWPEPPRSRCWMCPLQNDDEWLEVRADPELWMQAIALEKQLREKDPFVWLHRSCVPIDKVQFSPKDRTATGCDSGGCYT